MANAREIIKHHHSVQNIARITKTMEMIATARFQKAYRKAEQSALYTQAIQEMVSHLVQMPGRIEHPLLRKNDPSGKVMLLVLTSNRGLCGGYNNHVLDLVQTEFDHLRRWNRSYEIRVSGKKGIQYFRYHNLATSARYDQFDQNLKYPDIEPLAGELIDLYLNKKFESLRIFYTHYVSSSEYHAEGMTFFPLESLGESESQAQSVAKTRAAAALPPEKSSLLGQEYEFSPSPQELLQELIPAMLRSRLYRCFLESNICEQIARMRSMKAASENAEKMIYDLARQYNRARQGQITSELLDIIGGVEALK